MNTKITVVKALLLFKQKGDLYFLELIRSLNKVVAPGLGDLPGGKVEAEEPLEVALMREIKEETGIVVSHLQKIIDYQWLHGEQEYHEHLYCVLSPTQEVIIEQEEHDRYAWILFDALYESTLHPNMKKIIMSEKMLINSMVEKFVNQIV